jgi:hypothetical protein
MFRKISIALGTIIVGGAILAGTASCGLWSQPTAAEATPVPQIDFEQLRRDFQTNHAARIDQSYPINTWIDTIQDLVVVNGVAYVATKQLGIQVVDISDPGNPRGLQTIYIPNYVNNLVWHQNLLYATAGCTPGVLYIIDVKKPANSIPLGLEGLTCGGRFQIADKEHYVANNYSGLMILDISNPTTPQTISTISFNNSDPGPQSSHPSYTPMQMAYSIAVYNNFAFLATTGEQGDKQFVVDISNPVTPTIHAGNQDGSLSPHLYYQFDDRLYVLTRTGMAIRRLLNTGDNPQIGFYMNTIESQDVVSQNTDLYVEDDRVYLVNGYNGLEILDVSDPAMIQQLGVYAHNIQEPSAVWVENKIAYIADKVTGLHIVDITDPKEPKLLGTLH